MMNKSFFFIKKHILNLKLFYILYSVGAVLLLISYVLFAKRGFDVSDEGFYLAKVNGNIISGAESIPFDKLVNLYIGAFNIQRVLILRIINIILLLVSSGFFCYAFTKLIKINHSVISRILYYSSSTVSVLFFLNYYPNNISYNSLNVSFLLLTLGVFIIYYKSKTINSYFYLILAAFFLSNLFFIKIPTFVIIFSVLSVFILLSDKKIYFFSFLAATVCFVILLLYSLKIGINQYIKSLSSLESQGSYSIAELIALLFSYFNNYFLIIFTAVSILIIFKFLTDVKELFLSRNLVFYYIVHILAVVYFIYFFYYYFGMYGYEYEIYLVLFLIGMMAFWQNFLIYTGENQTLEAFIFSIADKIKFKRNDLLLITVILFLPILAPFGTNNKYYFAILPYLTFIAVPALAIVFQKKSNNYGRLLLLIIFLLLLYKGFYFGYIKYPYSIHFRESKLTSTMEYANSIKLKNIKLGPQLKRQILFVDSVCKANGYNKGDTMITFNFCDGIPFLMDAKILYSPMCNEDDFDYYYSLLNKKLTHLNKLYIIDNANSKIDNSVVTTKLGISSKNLDKIGSNSDLELYIYKK